MVMRIWLALIPGLLFAAGCSSRHAPASSGSSSAVNVVGFHLPTHLARQMRRGHYYSIERATLESRLQQGLGARLTTLTAYDGVQTHYESRQGRFVLQMFGTRTGIERATLRLHRVEGLSAKQREARIREIAVIAKTLLLGDEGTKWVTEAACGSVAVAISQSTEVHPVGKTSYALKAFAEADAEIDNEPTSPRLWISIGPHIEFEASQGEST